jgi:hypothetical protein
MTFAYFFTTNLLYYHDGRRWRTRDVNKLSESVFGWCLGAECGLLNVWGSAHAQGCFTGSSCCKGWPSHQLTSPRPTPPLLPIKTAKRAFGPFWLSMERRRRAKEAADKVTGGLSAAGGPGS